MEYVEKPLKYAHADGYKGARVLNVHPSLYLHPKCVYASSQYSGESAHIRMHVLV